MASFNADIESLKFFMRKLEDPKVQKRIQSLANEKGAVAIIADSIRDTFDREGPGWRALKAQTIRSSVRGKAGKRVAEMTDGELERHEFHARRSSFHSNPFRKILRRTSLLFRTVTTKTPGYSGSNKDVQGANIYKVEGSVITWGTNLVYARVQNEGGGRSKIPARPFLKPLNQKYQTELNEWGRKKVVEYLRESWGEILGGR